MAEDYEGTRREMERAIRRLNTFEYLLVGGAVLVAVIAGAIVAYLIHTLTGFPFFYSWVALSILFLVVPALFAILRERTTVGDRDRPEE